MQFARHIEKSIRPVRRVAISILALVFTVILSQEGHCGGKELPDGGPALYDQNCASCHQPLQKTLLVNRSVKRIRSAIDHVASMHGLRRLSESELEAIAVVLADSTAGR